MRMMSTGQRELKLCEEYEKQHCQDVTHALVLDMCWHITSTVQQQWVNTMQVRLKINVGMR